MTLKQLQAEWRSWDIKPANRTDRDDVLNECADSLTPFILQQERDRELIRALLDGSHAAWGKECELCKIRDEARSRLKEMEE